MVIHSNDPTARALTLRTLGAVAGVIPEKHQVHHAIRRALDSHDVVEVEAAIAASGQFAEKSKYALIVNRFINRWNCISLNVNFLCLFTDLSQSACARRWPR